jgi:hypothetical protein
VCWFEGGKFLDSASKEKRIVRKSPILMTLVVSGIKEFICILRKKYMRRMEKEFQSVPDTFRIVRIIATQGTILERLPHTTSHAAHFRKDFPW